MKKTKWLISLVLVICFILAATPLASAGDYDSYLGSMLDFMTEMYYKGFTDEEGFITVLKGMFSGLDEYSGFFDREEVESWYTSLENSYVGIGAVLENNPEGIKIIEVYKNSPAEKAGILSGDIITAVDGVGIVGKDSATVAAMIRGEEGTSVKLSIKRGGSTLSFTLVRAMVTRQSVLYRIEGKIGYIYIDTFSDGTSIEFSRAMDEMDKNKISKIILDLRGNTGGYVDEAVNVANELIPEGIITSLDYKSELFDDQVYYSDGNHPSYVVAVLVDENTASASEIVAGALEDSGVGYLIGRNTFGKGIFQSLFSILTPEAYDKYRNLYGDEYVSQIEWYGYHGVLPKDDELIGAVKITTGHYLTPKGRNIHGTGLKPSAVVANPTYPNNIVLSFINQVTGSGTTTLKAYKDEVYNAEQILAALGHFKAVPDKLFDEMTMEAVKKFQTSIKISATGTINDQTRDKLNQKLNELRVTNDKQYTKALELLSWFRD